MCLAAWKVFGRWQLDLVLSDLSLNINRRVAPHLRPLKGHSFAESKGAGMGVKVSRFRASKDINGIMILSRIRILGRIQPRH